MIKKIFLILFFSTMQFSCSSPASQFYVLTPLAHPSNLTKKASASIAIGPINIAEYLQQPSIVTRLTHHELVLNEFHRWAQPLESNINEIIINDLEVLLPNKNVVPYDSVIAENADYRVSIQITQFATDMTGNSDLTASWQIIQAKNNKIVRQYQRTISNTVNPYNFNSIVKAMSVNLNQLSQLIAKTI